MRKKSACMHSLPLAFTFACGIGRTPGWVMRVLSPTLQNLPSFLSCFRAMYVRDITEGCYSLLFSTHRSVRLVPPTLEAKTNSRVYQKYVKRATETTRLEQKEQRVFSLCFSVRHSFLFFYFSLYTLLSFGTNIPETMNLVSQGGQQSYGWELRMYCTST